MMMTKELFHLAQLLCRIAKEFEKAQIDEIFTLPISLHNFFFNFSFRVVLA